MSESVYIDKLVDIVNECSNTYHSKIKMKPIDVNSNTYINSNKEIDEKYPKFKIGKTVTISKYKNVFAKGDSKLVWRSFGDKKKVENTELWIYFVNDLNGEEIARTFYKK